jgi:hypothetical protein
MSQCKELCRHKPFCCFSTSVYVVVYFVIDSVRKLLDTPSYVCPKVSFSVAVPTQHNKPQPPHHLVNVEGTGIKPLPYSNTVNLNVSQAIQSNSSPDDMSRVATVVKQIVAEFSGNVLEEDCSQH